MTYTQLKSESLEDVSLITTTTAKNDVFHQASARNSTQKLSSLVAMMFLTFTFFLVEQITGHVTNSNSLVADSFHMLSDMMSFAIALAATLLSRRQFSARNTYGYLRAEVLGSLINSVFLLALCFSIILEAVQRLLEPHSLQNVNLVLLVGSLGFGLNSFGLVLFTCLGGHHFHTHGHDSPTHGHSHDMNIHGVFLHLLADTLGSVVIVLSGLAVKFLPDSQMAPWKLYVDPVLSIVLSAFIMASVCPLVKAACGILMQASRVDVGAVGEEIARLESVVEVVELHVWSLNSEINVASVCVRVEGVGRAVSGRVREVLKARNVQSVNVEVRRDEESE